ncbi:smoothelin, like isoform X1 [Mobula birostris]|uniref:smoothelin, like isoform X1 n=1 Tax=Mobula birostris TaxID=1983395 RepID=UPI003B28320B
MEPESVDQAVGYLEAALRKVELEVQGDMGALRRDVEQRIEEMLQLVKPLSLIVDRLQAENRDLRGQVQRLAQQVERLTGRAGRDADTAAGVCSEPAGRPGEQMTEQNGMEGSGPPHCRTEMAPLQSAREKEGTAPWNVPSPALQQHRPAAVSLAHLPITAVTKSGEKFSAEVSSGATPRSESLAQPAVNKPQTECVGQTAPQTGKNANGSRTLSSTTHSTTRDVRSPTSVLDLYPGVNSKPRSPPPTAPRQGGKRPQLMRSQTLPRTSAPQSRKALFEKFEPEGSRGRVGVSKGKLQRSQSFGVASASSIKQILLEWCRSKTIGYKLIDIQNFSSSWSTGMAFCALVHSFFPEAFDYNELNPSDRKHNFELAFGTAEKLAHCDRLIEVEDMMAMGNKPDPMCVFTYVQSLYNHLRRFE